MHISTIANDDGSFEIYFINLNYWEEFDLIVNILEKDNQCMILKSQDGIYSKLCQMKKNNIIFEVRHDDMLGNCIYVAKEQDIEPLERIANNVINKIEKLLEETKG